MKYATHLCWAALCTGAFLAASDVSPTRMWRRPFAITIVALHLVLYMWVLPHVKVDRAGYNVAQQLLDGTAFENSTHDVYWFFVLFVPMQAGLALALCQDPGNVGIWWALAVIETVTLIFSAFYNARESRLLSFFLRKKAPQAMVSSSSNYSI